MRRRRFGSKRVSIVAVAVLATGAAGGPALAQMQFPATLAGPAILPAATFVAAPADAPESLKHPARPPWRSSAYSIPS